MLNTRTVMDVDEAEHEREREQHDGHQELRHAGGAGVALPRRLVPAQRQRGRRRLGEALGRHGGRLGGHGGGSEEEEAGVRRRLIESIFSENVT